jgi:serine/threonine-protein kinase HipA
LLLKFDGVGKDAELDTGADFGRIEYAYYLMAKQAGVDMYGCRLLEEIKHHVQTLCAMDHLDFKQRGTHAYAQLFMVAARLGLGDAALDQVFRRMAFNVVARNCDDHTKNFAFRLKQSGDWELVPAYDVTHAYNPRGEWTYQHLMSVNGKFDDITRVGLSCRSRSLRGQPPHRAVKRSPRNLGHVVDLCPESWSNRFCVGPRRRGLPFTIAN